MRATGLNVLSSFDGKRTAEPPLLVMQNILCFGEILLRFSPAADGAWLTTQQMLVYLGGAELNVATALARWGLPVSYCTAMPDHFISHDLLSELRRRKLNTDTILFLGDRIGSYYLAQGNDLRHRAVIYDREHSSFRELKPGMIDWDRALHDISWLHFSAITPALSATLPEVCGEALAAASKRKITISIDLNYRAPLWKQRNPHEIVSKLLDSCDVVMGNIWAVHDLLGIPLDHALLQQNKPASYQQHAHHSALKLLKKFTRIKTVALTFRLEEREKGIQYFASLQTAHHWAESPVLRSAVILDKVGTGDCFMAGLIYGLIHQLPEKDLILFAASAGFGKFFEAGDATQQDVRMIWERIQRYA
jgi:2-dehydro-3-deoxygluconokinase